MYQEFTLQVGADKTRITYRFDIVQHRIVISTDMKTVASYAKFDKKVIKRS